MFSKFPYKCSNCGLDTIVGNRAKGKCKPCYDAKKRTIEQAARYAKTQRASIRKQVFEALGSKCECCGETKQGFLTVDHVNNDGAEHRRRQNPGLLYWDIKKEGFPKEKYRILCYNCNCGRDKNGGICPHKE